MTMPRCCIHRSPSRFLRLVILASCFIFSVESVAAVIEVRSPDGRNLIVLQDAVGEDERIRYSVKRDNRDILSPSLFGPLLSDEKAFGRGARIANVKSGEINEEFSFRLGKASKVINRCSYAIATVRTDQNVTWEVELRAYDDGVAIRYQLPQQLGSEKFEIRDEVTQFDVAGEPMVLFNDLKSFTTSHESLYHHQPLSQLPSKTLLDMPILLTWPDGPAAAITEARVREFAGAYLERPSSDSTTLQCRLSPHPAYDNASVVRNTPLSSPWRVVLLSDVAGELLESNLLLCLNDPPQGEFDWLQPGKTTWHWWSGDFENDYKLPKDSNISFERHCEYIDFCARNNITYHAVSGDGLAWYRQSKTGYGTPAPDADILTPRGEIQLPKIIEYARERGVGIRLWVHWKPLSETLEEAFAQYESWGIKGLMVDFLNRDDQEMVEFTDRMLASAARHKLHIQIHGSSKFSGEQRTFPHLLNREGVLNLEVLKWSDKCTPDHNLNVAYTRGLTGPVDYHQGGFLSVSRKEFEPQRHSPVVLGTRCHHLAMYVVYENPLPMVADSPSRYEDQPGFDFIRDVPTTWDETRFLTGDAGEYIVLARRKDNVWYIGGMTNWMQREIEVPMTFLNSAKWEASLYVDGSLDESRPNAIRRHKKRVDAETHLKIALAPGGGFVAVVREK